MTVSLLSLGMTHLHKYTKKALHLNLWKHLPFDTHYEELLPFDQSNCELLKMYAEKVQYFYK